MTENITLFAAARKEIAKQRKTAEALERADEVLETAIAAEARLAEIAIEIGIARVTLVEANEARAAAAEDHAEAAARHGGVIVDLEAKARAAGAAKDDAEAAAANAVRACAARTEAAEAEHAETVAVLERERAETRRALASDREEYAAFRKKMGMPPERAATPKMGEG